MTKTAKLDTDKTLEVKEAIEVDNSTEGRLGRLETHMQQSIVVTNNLITFCNTIEKWRKMDFVQPGTDTKEDSEENNSTEEANKD